jgi:formyl-CoA transferase
MWRFTLVQEKQSLLKGVRILDLSRVLAGPYCSMVFGDLGAEVIKIESCDKGDDTRHWGPPFADDGASAYYLSVNRNKKSVTLNLKSKEGRSILKELISKSDVVVENFRVGTMKKWGLGYDDLKKSHPDLIYCSITGFGNTGPYKDKPGYDFIIQALGGLMSVTGPIDGPPSKAGVAVIDIFAGLFASNAILASLFARQSTGQGQQIDISLLDSAIAILANQASNYLVSGEIPKRHGNAHPNIVPYEVFKAKDSYFTLGIGNDLQWQKFCNLINFPQWAEDSPFSNNKSRVENRDALITNLNEVFVQQSSEHWLSLLGNAGIPAAPINNMEDLFNDPQVKARKMLITMLDNQGRPIPMVASPLKISMAPPSYRIPPPQLGASTDEVLETLAGINPKDIEDLRKKNVI